MPRPITLAAALLLACGSLAALPAPAVAAPHCTGSACTGQDPQATGCGADATTAASFSGTSVRVELRKSPTCQAAWARSTSAPPNQVLYVENTKGVRRQITTSADLATQWTAMADATAKTRACLGVPDSDVITCTPWG